jgi:hypothetical protein
VLASSRSTSVSGRYLCAARVVNHAARIACLADEAPLGGSSVADARINRELANFILQIGIVLIRTFG